MYQLTFSNAKQATTITLSFDSTTSRFNYDKSITIRESRTSAYLQVDKVTYSTSISSSDIEYINAHNAYIASNKSTAQKERNCKSAYKRTRATITPAMLYRDIALSIKNALDIIREQEQNHYNFDRFDIESIQLLNTLMSDSSFAFALINAKEQEQEQERLEQERIEQERIEQERLKQEKKEKALESALKTLMRGGICESVARGMLGL